MSRLGFFIIVCLACVPPVFSEDSVLSIESTITGSQEQPKVFYIIPWKSPQGPGDLYRPIVGGVIEDQILAPIDREVFQRRIDYYQHLSVSPAAKNSVP